MNIISNGDLLFLAADTSRKYLKDDVSTCGPSMYHRVRPRFFDQVGHETMYASSGNKHIFNKLCHCQAYQNYEQPPRKSLNLYFQSHFSVLKIGRIFPKKKFYEEYWTRRPTFIKKCF